MRLFFFVLAFLCSTAAARADVTFDWVNETSPGCCSGSLTVSDAILSGPISITFDGADPAYYRDNTVPITSLDFSWTSEDPGVYAGFWLSEPDSRGLRDPCSSCRWTFNIALDGDRLMGSIAMRSGSIEGAIASEPDGWSFLISTENPYVAPECRRYPGCAGHLSGYFLRAPGSPQPVPEPLSLALLGAGLASALLLRRRRA